LTRCAEDAALVVSALAVPDIRDGHSMNFPRRTASVAEPISIAEVKIGVPRGAITDRTELEPVMAAFENALSKLAPALQRLFDGLTTGSGAVLCPACCCGV
jgi:Asp-tRNA(Asn)/Glu-tRNA(Gln) amidotransferase A subunit family amidase